MQLIPYPYGALAQWSSCTSTALRFFYFSVTVSECLQLCFDIFSYKLNRSAYCKPMNINLGLILVDIKVLFVLNVFINCNHEKIKK